MDPQLQTMINNMPAKTGKSLEEWFSCISVRSLSSHGEIMKFLKEEHKVTHGFANTISILFRQNADGAEPSGAELIANQYKGDKSALLPIYNSIVNAVSQFGNDVEIAPKKTYVSLRRNKQFAIVQASTKTRIDLGLNLKDLPVTSRLEDGAMFGGMCQRRVRLERLHDIDAELISWLKQAYQSS